jgi:hypothetical protein
LPAIASPNAKERTLRGTEVISGTGIISGTTEISFLEIPFGMITPTTGMIIPTTANGAKGCVRSRCSIWFHLLVPGG